MVYAVYTITHTFYEWPIKASGVAFANLIIDMEGVCIDGVAYRTAIETCHHQSY